MSDHFDPGTIERAVELARILQQRAIELQTPAERRQQAELDQMLQTPSDMPTLVQMTDQAFRSKTPSRTVDQFTHILDVQGIPRFFSPIDRALLFGFQSFGGWMPGVAVPLVKERMQHETANVVLPAEHDLLCEHLRARTAAGLRMNVNILGEALLGEGEAAARLERYIETLRLPEIEVLSVKISTLYSQISPLAFDHTVALLCDRLEPLYREAARQRFEQPDGASVPKFVYLDMEEYRDLRLTAEAFMRTLDRDGLEKVEAGIALQAYIPDSAEVQRAINRWARERVARGGAPVTIRLVKGANLAMERIEASLRGWPQAPFKSKRETDANYKRMMFEAFQPENLAAVRIGVASHNLFDLSLALVLTAERHAGDRVQFEMLEGMANHQRRAIEAETRSLLLYAPACRKPDFVHAIGYLVRRLDENSAPENFLRHAFRLQVDSEEWRTLENGFRAAFAEEVPQTPRRTQDRRGMLDATNAVGGGDQSLDTFTNEPDTDFTLPANIEWARQLLARWRTRGVAVPVVVAGNEETAGRNQHPLRDPSVVGQASSLVSEAASAESQSSGQAARCTPDRLEACPTSRWHAATLADVERAVACARRDDDGWRALSFAERSAILAKVAHELRAARADLIGAALANAGKTIAEADPEVSEAVDFVEFYRDSARLWAELPQAVGRGRGVIVVVSPWNFPIAIPCGGIAAALAAGNTVILKPSSDAVLPAWEVCSCFWRAGISKKTLQFLPCSSGTHNQPAGSETGILPVQPANRGQVAQPPQSVEACAAALVAHDGVDGVILTGGTNTALRILQARPALRLFAETGGKNATIVTALADREQAIRNVLHSAFSHAGQKCSATSLLLLEAELYDDPDFREALRDAAQSLRVGSAWDLPTRIGPLIREPAGDLRWALTSLDEGEEWLVRPEHRGGQLWSPGIKLGVQPGSRSHRTEFFGPVLSVMRFRSLEAAIEIVNGTGYGLTSGIESLDDREIAFWQSRIRAGNLYINRPTTGAIVLRQPFGGMGKSSVGPGMKAGGPNYVAQFMQFDERLRETPGRDIEHPRLADLRMRIRGAAPEEPEMGRLITAIESYDRTRLAEFACEHDDFRLLGEDNVRRYRPIREVRIRIDSRDSFFEILARVCAAKAAGCRITVSSAPGAPHPVLKTLERLTESWAASIEFIEETDEQLAAAIRAGQTRRVRYPAPERVPDSIRAAAATVGFYIADAPVLVEGRIELLWYLREQSVSHSYHRYGNLGARASEPRAEPD